MFLSIIRKTTLYAVVALTALLSQNQAFSHSFDVGKISLEHPYATATVPGVKNGAVYFRVIKNAGDKPDKLIGAQSSVAERVELHSMRMDGNIMRMREINSIDIPAKGELQLRHTSEAQYHLMLMNLKAPLRDGDKFKVKLKFESAGETEITVNVQKTKEAAHDHKHH